MFNQKKFLLFLVIGIAIFTVSPAEAVLIVDTGPGPPDSTGGWSLASFQWLAAEFEITEEYRVNEILGWIDGFGGTGTIALYDDGGEIPGTEVFSTPFSTPVQTSPDWHGASGLTVDLLAGTYWVSFEVRPGDTLYAWMPDPSNSPLGNEAQYGSGAWSDVDFLDIGIRIDAELMSPVPEPATMLLLGSGLLGLAGFRRRFRKR